MYLQLDTLESVNPDFHPPKLHNGEAMELASVEALGTYVVARYVGQKPGLGEPYTLDLYCNDHGQEVFRVKANILQPPPPRPTFGQRFLQALRYIFAFQS
jgi:hypothetical protein